MQKIVLVATWVINILFWAGFIPQIILNFRLKTTRGISDLMLFAFFNGYISYNYYVFCCDLPMAYKVISPISLVTVIVMLSQRLTYEKNSKRLLMLYITNGILGFVFIPYAISNTAFIGNSMGWISAAIWLILPVPQITKIFMERSVVGFSFALVSLVALGDLIQSIIAIVLQLPTQTLFNGVRGVAIYLVYCLQFLFYRKIEETRFHGAVLGYEMLNTKKIEERKEEVIKEVIKGA